MLGSMQAIQRVSCCAQPGGDDVPQEVTDGNAGAAPNAMEVQTGIMLENFRKVLRMELDTMQAAIRVDIKNALANHTVGELDESQNRFTISKLNSESGIFSSNSEKEVSKPGGDSGILSQKSNVTIAADVTEVSIERDQSDREVSTKSKGTTSAKSATTSMEAEATVSTKKKKTGHKEALENSIKTPLQVFYKWLKYQFTFPPSFKQKAVVHGRARVIESMSFKVITGCLVVLNTLYLGFYAETNMANHYDRLKNQDHVKHWWIIPQCFEGLFLLELIIRLWALRAKFFFGEGLLWNWLDFIVVIVPGIWVITNYTKGDRDGEEQGSMGFQVPGLSILRSARVIKLMQTFELFRLPIFAEFRMIVNSLILSLPSLIWVSILAAFTLYVAGVGFVLSICSKLGKLQADDPGDLIIARQLEGTWPGLSQTLLVLFQSITGGVDWIEPWYSLQAMHWSTKISFILYMVFMSFAMLNIISGMFIERAFRVVNNDRDFWILEEAKQSRMYADRLLGLFHELQKDYSANIAWEEFDKHLDNPHIAAYFSWLGVDVTNAYEMFQLIDSDSDGMITVKEFLEGCMDLKGPASNASVQGLRNVVNEINENLYILKGEDSSRRRKSLASQSVYERKSRFVDRYKNIVPKELQTKWKDITDQMEATPSARSRMAGNNGREE